MRRSSSIFSSIAAIVGVFLLVLLLADIAKNAYGRSTSGVKEVYSGVICLPVSETLVLKQRVGKVSYEWRVTYDGESTVLFTRKASLFASEEQREIRSPRGVETPVEFGLFRQGLTVKTETGAAYVSYPSGFFSTWTFRPHREPVR